MVAATRTQNPFRLLLHVPVPWVFVLTYLAGVGLERVFRSSLGRPTSPVVGFAGGALFILGAVIAGWGLMTFRHARTTTVPGERSARLVTWGPYRFTRNPMYVGLTAAYLGEAGMLHHVWPVVLLPCVLAYVNWIVIPLEESRLSEVFRVEYAEYRARVRRWI
jgi:protein-S-isoprenylcysteine O-methyltransferase Ste14